MKVNLFVRPNCDFCKEVIVPDNVKVEYIDADSLVFKGLQTPTIQVGNITLAGPNDINNLLKVLSNDEYRIRVG